MDEFRILLEHLASVTMPYFITGDLNIGLRVDRLGDPPTVLAINLLGTFGASCAIINV